jgi:hypothetical protein
MRRGVPLRNIVLNFFAVLVPDLLPPVLPRARVAR